MANIANVESPRGQMLGDIMLQDEFDGEPWPAIASPQDARRTNDAAPPADSPRRQPSLPQPSGAAAEFVPLAPATFGEIGLTASEIEGLVLKFLSHRGALAGREIAGQIKLPYPLVAELLREFKSARLLTYKAESGVGDYVCEITDLGCQRALRHAQRGSYFGAAPVSLAAYTAAVRAQTIANERPKLVDLQRAFGELTLSPMFFDRLGQ
ncbi:MAG TPA: hypothetical protein VGX76_17520, partial [Pirellulales bacterium]|nr:hypothetical protein [Pirellulales bacterium]